MADEQNTVNDNVGGGGTAGDDKIAVPGAAGTGVKTMSYVDIFKKMGGKEPQTDDEVEEQAKKERRSKIFAALGDGLSALGNIFMHHAPAAQPSKTLTDQNRERWERLKQEQKENNEAYMRAMQLDKSQELANAKWAHQLEMDAAETERKNKESEDKSRLAEVNILVANKRLDKTTAEADRARIIADNEKENQELGRREKEASITLRQAQTKEHLTRTERERGKYTFMGQTYSSENEMNRAILGKAKELGVSEYVIINGKTKTVDNDGTERVVQKSETKKKDIDQVAAECEAKAADLENKKKKTVLDLGGGTKEGMPTDV